MRNITEIISVQNGLPIGLLSLHVVACCQTCAELEKQISSIKLQERYCSHLISGNSH